MKSCKGILGIYHLQSLFKECKHLPFCATPATNRTGSWRKIQMPLQSLSEKKWVAWNKLSSDLQILTHRGDRNTETNDPKSELRNHSLQELIYFTFHSNLLIWEKGEKGEGRNHTKRVFHAWMELKKVGWTFPTLEKVHLQLWIALLQAIRQSDICESI